MTPQPFPAPEELTICFAHVAYQLETIFARRQSGLAGSAPAGQQRIRFFQAWTPEDLAARLPEADVLLVSGFWKNELLDVAPRLRFIQSIGAGVDQFDLDRAAAPGHPSGHRQRRQQQRPSANMRWPSSWPLPAHIHTGRDRQQRRAWRGMIGDLSLREDELGGKTLLIIGLGKIGSRLAKLAKALRHARPRHEAQSGRRRRSRRCRPPAG